ncbi:MAG: flagellar biosynthetic protein FliO [Gammaproteobacteria bacterium]|nr:flagellar biosynthetic protein FliO [Gammaproteobacteria bacterium]
MGPGLVLAAEGVKSPSPAMPVPTVGYLEVMGGLVLVVALILVMGWAVKRMGLVPANHRGVVRVLGGISLGGRERALLLEADGKRVLVGVAPGQVRPLLVLDDEHPNSSSDASQGPGFSSALEQAQTQIHQAGVKPATPTKPEEPVS